jgi:hypothetical protein
MHDEPHLRAEVVERTAHGLEAPVHALGPLGHLRGHSLALLQLRPVRKLITRGQDPIQGGCVRLFPEVCRPESLAAAQHGAQPCRHTGVTFGSHRRHTSVTFGSHRRHTGVTSVSHRRHTGVTFVSHRRHTGVTLVSHLPPAPSRAPGSSCYPPTPSC